MPKKRWKNTGKFYCKNKNFNIRKFFHRRDEMITAVDDGDVAMFILQSFSVSSVVNKCLCRLALNRLAICTQDMEP